TYIPHGSVSCTSLVTSLFTLLQPPCSRLCPYTTLFRSQPRSDAATLLATHTTQKPRRTRPQLLNLRNRPNLGLPRTPPPLRRLLRLLPRCQPPRTRTQRRVHRTTPRKRSPPNRHQHPQMDHHPIPHVGRRTNRLRSNLHHHPGSTRTQKWRI